MGCAEGRFSQEEIERVCPGLDNLKQQYRNATNPEDADEDGGVKPLRECGLQSDTLRKLWTPEGDAPGPMETIDECAEPRSTNGGPVVPPLAWRPDSIEPPPGPLSAFFQKAYHFGDSYGGPEYMWTQKPELGEVKVYEHPSGIMVWAEAVDLTFLCRESPGQVLYCYMSLERFSSVLAANKEVDAAERIYGVLATTGDEAPFGEGIYAACREPQVFRKKEEVLLNMHWPMRVLDLGKTDPRNPMHLLSQGNPQSGPDDPTNQEVRRAVMRQESTKGSVDYCVPLIVPERFAHCIWKRCVPKLHGKVFLGCNRWGDRQFPERDLWVVAVPQQEWEAKSVLSARNRTEQAKRRVNFLVDNRGDDSDMTLIAMGDLIAALRAEGRLKEAEEIAARELKNMEQHRGADHPDTVRCLVEVAKLQEAQGNVTAAEAMYRTAIQSQERTLGPEHMDTSTSCNVLAQLFLKQNRFAEAEFFIRRTFKSRDRILGRNHQDTRKSLSDLVMVLFQQHKMSEAEPYARRACDDAQNCLGPQHKSTLNCLDNLAAVLEPLGKLDEADTLVTRVYEGHASTLGDDHEETLKCLLHLSTVKEARGDLSMSMLMVKKVCEGFDKTMGPMHPETMEAVEHLIMQLFALDKEAEAEPYCRRLVQYKEKTLGPDNEETIVSTSYLAKCAFSLNNLDESVQLFLQVVAGCEKTLGVDHPETLTNIGNLAKVYQALGKHDEAQKLRVHTELAEETPTMMVTLSTSI